MQKYMVDICFMQKKMDPHYFYETIEESMISRISIELNVWLPKLRKGKVLSEIFDYIYRSGGRELSVKIKKIYRSNDAGDLLEELYSSD